MDHPSDDIVVLVDESDQVIGTALKRDTHHSQTPLHRGFSVFLFNRRGEVLLQQRALTKQTWPGIWSNSCCGHPMPGETVALAAERRLRFELGLANIELTMALPDFRYRVEKDGIVENEICPVLVGFTEMRPVLNSDEIAEVKWVGWPEFVESLDDPAVEISPWAMDEARLLAASDVFQAEFERRTSIGDV